MEEDGNSVVLAVAVSVSHSLYLFDLGVEHFWDSVGDAMFKVGEDVIEASFDHFGGLDNRLKA